MVSYSLPEAAPLPIGDRTVSKELPEAHGLPMKKITFLCILRNNDGVLQLAKIAIACEGYRVSSIGHH